ncbi:MAG: Type 1 glutamine amidotransferase-like domain-containing protein [SAR202 cluster bacterium]|jgi:cyanophycinase|nr:Type 1 glutamine amidotransferase-like domain-containing protein [SAR202 cluster bacterium]MDP6514527.1 Type 1 glutamine amidotransferase-like domain-containing protein [SAR202 cluster bacterium]MDP6716044.1 Type 1 glutamine amidotransferase-like domain-containing protein [SAR202 cluster bacterium]
MSGYVALVGGDEFRPGCEDFDRAMLEATGVARPKLLVLPTAAAHENPSRAASNGVGYFSELGADASPLMVVDGASANDEGIASEVEDAHVIYMTGGNPAHLLDSLSGSVLLARMTDALERGAVIAGSSAGAMVMGSWMRFRQWREALGIAEGIATLPHHERADSPTVAKELASTTPNGLRAVFGVCGRTGCLGSPDGRWTVYGPGDVTVYQQGQWRSYGSGESFEIQ